ncbi:MAG: hypothetical protein M1815_005369 [Lichina confinis]|nr:MAG: hypothetical protein M1815_005369 [Lichina confinis]
MNQASEASEPSGIPSTKALVSGAAPLSLAAKKGCYDDAFLTYGVLPKPPSKEDMAQPSQPMENYSEDSETLNIIANAIPKVDPRRNTGGQDRGQEADVNPTPPKLPSNGLDRHGAGSGRSGLRKPPRKQKVEREKPEERGTPYYPLKVYW